VAFGINRAISDGETQSWYPFVDGIGYWNEDMPTFSDDLHALDPYGHPDSELTEDYNLIGWSQDVDGDGEITFVGTGTDAIGLYYVSLSSFPQLVLDESNHLFLVYASVTETYSNGLANYRHIWARASLDGGATWLGFVDLTSDLIHIFDECVYPSCSPASDGNIYLVYQTDNEPGVNIWGTTHPVTDNNITFMKVSKSEITDIEEQSATVTTQDVSQNYPNPFSETSTVYVRLDKPANLVLEISGLSGQLIYSKSFTGHAGNNELLIDGKNLQQGVYFYSVKTDDSQVTKKMIVR
ncbi:MAG: T9SS type A sorting domain-containing protein, partial [Bacteroidales bacterium]|nr:T9SS type A sorting domain-containing protein [Bacteroidales bacterium]